MQISRVGTFSTGWGESLVWDEVRQRLYFADCAASTVHWLEQGEGDELHTLPMPSMPTGIVPASDGRLVVVLDDGLHVVDPDTARLTLLAAFPPELGGRCNDACADLDGNLITGKMNLGPAEGSAWWFSATHGWRLLDDDISNTNGPNVGVIDGSMKLIIGDTSAHYYSYDYDATTGTATNRAIFGDVSHVEGLPDGAALDDAGGLWAALVGGHQIGRFTSTGLDRLVQLPVARPTDVAFGGPDLDRLYVTSVASRRADAGSSANLAGALLVIDGLPVRGRPEPRFDVG